MRPGGKRDTEDTPAVDTEFARVVQAGIRGTQYQHALHAVAAYGFRVISVWIRTGKIFKECAAKGWYIPTPNWFDPADVDDLISDTITEGLALFRRQIDARRWDPLLGAAATTYFTGSCVLSFPNVIRRHTKNRTERLQALTPTGDSDTTWPDRPVVQSPEHEVAVRSLLRSAMADLTSSQQQVIARSAFGLSHEEIASDLGLSCRAVEGQLRRARAELRKRLAL